jgi:hypothetical protein
MKAIRAYNKTDHKIRLIDAALGQLKLPSEDDLDALIADVIVDGSGTIMLDYTIPAVKRDRKGIQPTVLEFVRKEIARRYRIHVLPYIRKTFPMAQLVSLLVTNDKSTVSMMVFTNKWLMECKDYGLLKAHFDFGDDDDEEEVEKVVEKVAEVKVKTKKKRKRGRGLTDEEALARFDVL